MIQTGKKAPQFTLPDALRKSHSLKDYKGKWVVVYFYPKDNTPGCTTEAIQFTALSDQYKKANAVVIGISKDSCESHAKFIDAHKLQVVLLSDPEGKVVEEYGAWGEKNMYGKTSMGIIRSTAIVDPDGTVVKVYSKVKAEGHAQEVLDAIRSKDFA